MNKIIALGAAGAVALTAVFGAVAPANAQMGPWWWYRPHYHHYYYGPGPAIGAGILGFAAGAAIAGAARDRAYVSGDDHIAACEEAYRSYDVRTDTYLGYDGLRHYCEL
jgi:hypothetical protein